MDLVRTYHERSKHHLERYAPGPGGLDWNSQPDPFRRYAGAPLLQLPLLAGELPVCWDELFGAAIVPRKALSYAAAEIAALTGVNRADDFPPDETEAAEVLAWVGPGEPSDPELVLASLSAASWSGFANTLSAIRRDRPDIPAVAAATRTSSATAP